MMSLAPYLAPISEFFRSKPEGKHSLHYDALNNNSSVLRNTFLLQDIGRKSPHPVPEAGQSLLVVRKGPRARQQRGGVQSRSHSRSLKISGIKESAVRGNFR